MADILVVDDDQSVASAFERFLAFEGHGCRLVATAADALRSIEERRPDLVMMDIRMPGVDGIEALEQVRARFPGLAVVMMTGYGTSQTSIDAIRAGAFDYLTKPLDLDDLRAIVDKALAANKTAQAAGAVETADLQAVLVGETPVMREVYKLIGRLATNDVPALIVGERGTGKGLVVATLHDSGSRRDRPLLVIDCAHPHPALEDELFTPGIGTVHLENVGALPLPLQVRLARALANEPGRAPGRSLEARLVASTDRDLADAVSSGAFSQALHDILAIITLRLPPLRERRDDIPLLIRHFVQQFNVELNRTIKGVDDAAARLLRDHSWPGNVGELERVLKRGAIVARGEAITASDLGALTDTRFQGGADAELALCRAVRTAFHDRLVDNRGGRSASALRDIVDLVETTLVKEALVITNRNQVKAADLLGVNRSTIRKKTPPETS